ncbi:efflux RND transporter permease subunit [Thermocoleostomius sinensis]|uniref:Efflux RND transporter permease subunit n=1 Tax=Thermocoleostomius sinensis A174 TaxID=2016057 RepID=A0A9E9C8H4_9CYAN|nr:efflux RND transporter permease subunit [Thermocoleostomius sinensis]WAL58442.1 efflux RND transporter permease subunit [Thermocoleostomius sinensis A174]
MTQSGMSVSSVAIRRHIGTLMLTLTAIVLGVFFLVRLPVDLLPSITYPRIGVRLAAPGISPEVAVDEITRPLEEALAATDGVEQVYSQTREGQVSIDLYFRPGGNIDQALNDTTATFNRARGTLPDTVQEPRLFKVDPSQLPVYEFALTSSQLQGVDLRVFADEELARELTVVPGVANVDVSGGVREEVQVNLDLNRLQALGVGLTDVLNELTDRNQDVSGGRISGGSSEALTRTVGRFQDAEEIRNLSFEVNSPASSQASNSDSSAAARSLQSTAPRRVYLRDFAEVVDGTEDERVFVSLNGQPAVKVSIQKQPDANTVTVVEGVKQRLATLQSSGLIPEDVSFITTLDESRFIQNSIRNVATAGLIGAGLAAISVLLFLGSLRQTLIVVVAIPLATLLAILLMGLFGLSLNVFSLGGLALGVGIVVDNSIVMLESIVMGVNEVRLRHLHQNNDQNNSRNNGQNNSQNNSQTSSNGNGHHPTPANHDHHPDRAHFNQSSSQAIIGVAEQSSQQLESALLASTTTNLVAVLPFLLIGGFVSLLFNELILTISFAVAASLVVALTVVPMFTSRLLAVRWSSGIGNFWPLRQFRLRLQGLTRHYQRLLRWVLRRRIWVIALVLVVFGGGSFLMVGNIPQEILPSINTGQARLFAQFPPGTPLQDNRKVMQAIDQLLLEQPEVDYVFSTAGGFLFGNNTSENALRGSSTITLKSGTDVQAFTDRMNGEFNRLNLVNTRLRLTPESVRGLILNNSPIRGAEVDVALQGPDERTLRQAGAQVLAALDEQATLARYRPDADQPQPEVQIRPDWERTAALGLTAQQIGDTIQTAIEGDVPTQLQRGDRLVDVRVQLRQNTIKQPGQLRQLPLFTRNNQLVRLGDVATIELGQAPGEIQRINQRQVYLIAGNLSDGASLGAALEEMNRIVNSIDFPEGVSLLPSSSAESNRQIQSSLGTLGGLAAFLVFVVMAVQYNSLIDPLVIMVTVPFALAGGILGLFITQTAIGATVIVGAVLLVGIVVNNAIIMVELANQIRSQHQVDHATAILRAAPERLQPILMTTITTVLGMFPLALGLGEGSEFLQPLGVVVFSGLSLATLLTLFIIPCFYTLFHDPRLPRLVKRMSKEPQKLLRSKPKQKTNV